MLKAPCPIRISDLVCLSHLRWDGTFPRPRRLMARAARERRVLFIEEARCGNGPPRMDVRQDPTGVRVAVPHLPSDALERQRAPILRALLDVLLDREAVHDFLVWHYTPMALDFANDLEPLVTVYDCTGLTAVAEALPEMVRHEAELFERADLVFTGGKTLFERLRRGHRRVHLFPDGIDVDHTWQSMEVLICRAAMERARQREAAQSGDGLERTVEHGPGEKQDEKRGEKQDDKRDDEMPPPLPPDEPTPPPVKDPPAEPTPPYVVTQPAGPTTFEGSRRMEGTSGTTHQ